MELRSRTARAIILPEHGGRLHQLFVTADGAEHALLMSPGDPAEYSAQPHRGGSFVMAPWPNRIAGGRFRFNGREWAVPITSGANAIHGLVAGAPWRVVARTARVVELSCVLGEAWPWPGSVWQRIELTDSALRLKLEVRAEREPFPAGCGWHPWFRRDVAGARAVRIAIPSSHHYALQDQIPTGETAAPQGQALLDGRAPLGERRLDDCYAGLASPIVIHWDSLSLRMLVTSAQPHVMVYTPAEAVCIEPQTCAPDAFNLEERGISGSGFAIATPGRPVAIECRWEWSGTVAP